MSGPPDHPVEMAPLDQIDPNYTVYDNRYANVPRTTDNPSSYEGFGFWYRPENQESGYNTDAAFSHHSRSLPLPTMDMPLALKHKRTRSGCFTCRQRRVKCDETRPICDRCRKGNRQCEFPSKTSGSKKMKLSSPTSPAVAKDRAEQQSVPASIKEESEDDSSDADEDRLSSMYKNPVTELTKPSVPLIFPTSSAKDLDMMPTSTKVVHFPNNSVIWQELPQEIQKYLQYQRDHMTYYHYGFKADSGNFVHGELVNLALQFEPLLHATVAFIAYHYATQLPDMEAEFESFWKYYAKSIETLLLHLKNNGNRNDLVLLTVLQLATFEEHMGDWNSLVKHHRAALDVLTWLYTPQTIMETERGRKIFDWYVRLDVVAGLMANRNAALDRSWLAYACDWHEKRSKLAGSGALQEKQEFFGKAIELVGYDIAHLFAEASDNLTATFSGQSQSFSIEAVKAGVDDLHERLERLRWRIQELHGPSLTGDNANPIQTPEGSVFNPDIPLFKGALWPLNFVWLDWYCVSIMLRNSMSMTLQKAQIIMQADEESQTPTPFDYLQQQVASYPAELSRYSITLCEIYNAIATSAMAPAGVIFVCYAAMGLSTIFLPVAPPIEHSRYTTWARQQLARFERQGFIWPPHFRKQMATLWQIPEVEDWWLPNDEDKTELVERIRNEVALRAMDAQENEQYGQDEGRDLRELKGLFEMMDLERRGSVDTLNRVSRSETSYVSSPVGMAEQAIIISSPTENARGTVTMKTRGSISETSNVIEKGRSRGPSKSSTSGG